MMPSAALPRAWEPSGHDLDGRVIAIAGASGGLGSATAQAVAEAGATAVLIGRRKKALEACYDAVRASGGPEPLIVTLDLETATPDTCAAMIEALRGELGRLDGLVHAAAMFEGLTPLAVHAPDEWLRVMQVNLSAPFALTQAALPLLQEAADGVVVFVTDDPERLARAHWGAYGVSKAGVERMAAILHEETLDSSVRVHVLLPGPMRTPLRRMAWFGEDTLKQPTPQAAAQSLVYLLGRQGAAARGHTLDLRPPGSSRRNPAR